MKMKGTSKTFITLLLMITLLFSGINPVYAAGKPKSMKLNKTKATLYVGDNLKLKVVKVSPNKASKSVTWKSSNSKIASVSRTGLVKAKAAGTATITAVSNKKSSIKAKCVIKVKTHVQKNSNDEKPAQDPKEDPETNPQTDPQKDLAPSNSESDTISPTDIKLSFKQSDYYMEYMDSKDFEKELQVYPESIRKDVVLYISGYGLKQGANETTYIVDTMDEGATTVEAYYYFKGKTYRADADIHIKRYSGVHPATDAFMLFENVYTLGFECPYAVLGVFNNECHFEGYVGDCLDFGHLTFYVSPSDAKIVKYEVELEDSECAQLIQNNILVAKKPGSTVLHIYMEDYYGKRFENTLYYTVNDYTYTIPYIGDQLLVGPLMDVLGSSARTVSTDSSVATVDHAGLITGIQQGDCGIRVYIDATEYVEYKLHVANTLHIDGLEFSFIRGQRYDGIHDVWLKVNPSSTQYIGLERGVSLTPRNLSNRWEVASFEMWCDDPDIIELQRTGNLSDYRYTYKILKKGTTVLHARVTTVKGAAFETQINVTATE